MSPTKNGFKILPSIIKREVVKKNSLKPTITAYQQQEGNIAFSTSFLEILKVVQFLHEKTS